MIVNGKETVYKANQTLEEWVVKNGYVKERIAIEVNGRILLKAEYTGYVLNEHDNLEVVTFVGGG